MGEIKGSLGGWCSRWDQYRCGGSNTKGGVTREFMQRVKVKACDQVTVGEPPRRLPPSSHAYLGINKWQVTPSRLDLARLASSGMQGGNSGWLRRFIRFSVNVYASPGQVSPGSSHTFPQPSFTSEWDMTAQAASRCRTWRPHCRKRTRIGKKAFITRQCDLSCAGWHNVGSEEPFNWHISYLTLKKIQVNLSGNSLKTFSQPWLNDCFKCVLRSLLKMKYTAY